MQVPTPPSKNQPHLQVIERIFSLVDLLATQQEPMSLKDISTSCGLHPSTTHRLLNDLAMGHYVDRTEVGQYRLGLKWLELGNMVKARLNVRNVALEPMQQLHLSIDESVNLSLRQGDEIVYIERSYSERSGMQVIRAIGGRAPLHLTSVGKLFLSQETPEQLLAYAQRTQLRGNTKNSITSMDRLQEELRHVRQQKSATDNEELELGVKCLAAGIFDDQKQMVAGLSISAPAERIQEAWVQRLQQTAQDISSALGHKS